MKTISPLAGLRLMFSVRFVSKKLMGLKLREVFHIIWDIVICKSNSDIILILYLTS